jgi:hypothetical protein
LPKASIFRSLLWESLPKARTFRSFLPEYLLKARIFSETPCARDSDRSGTAWDCPEQRGSLHGARSPSGPILRRGSLATRHFLVVPNDRLPELCRAAHPVERAPLLRAPPGAQTRRRYLGKVPRHSVLFPIVSRSFLSCVKPLEHVLTHIARLAPSVAAGPLRHRPTSLKGVAHSSGERQRIVNRETAYPHAGDETARDGARGAG